MASSIQLLRSSTARERPLPGNLLDGQPAINTNQEEPGLFFKASDGSLVKVGPAAITSDGSPPNQNFVGLSGNSTGELWLDKSSSPASLKIFDGSTWVQSGQTDAITEIIAGSNISVSRSNNSVTISSNDLGYVSIKSFGAIGDGIEVDNEALKKAITAAVAANKPLYIPAGTYRILNIPGNPIRIPGSLTMFGDGMYVSTFKYVDMNGTGRNDFLRMTTAATGGQYDVELRDLGIVGDWGDGNDWTTPRSHLMELAVSGSISLVNVFLSKSRFFATAFTADRVSAVNCVLTDIARDGISVRRTRELTVVGCYFKGVIDDAIAHHVSDSQNSPIESYTTIVGNSIIDSQGICVLGSKHCTITGNKLTRITVRAIHVGFGAVRAPFGSEGNTPTFSISIVGNTIDTVFSGNVFGPAGGWVGYIFVGGGPLLLTTPVYNPDGSGGIVSPYPHFYTNNNSLSAGINTGANSIVISDNVCMRSLEPVAAYSDYGFGPRLGKLGYADPQITEGALGIASTNAPSIAQVRLTGAIFNTKISNNVLYGGGTAISIGEGNKVDPLYEIGNLSITGNIITNFRYSGIRVSASRGDFQITSNVFDGDPLHTNPFRLANGKWADGGEAVTAVWNDGGSAMIFNGNQIKNVYWDFTGTTPNLVQAEGNTYICDPISSSSPDNKGIRTLRYPLTGQKNNLMIVDSDPSSSNYGLLINNCLTTSTNSPTSGKYLKGWTVFNSSPTISGAPGSQYIITGWLRLTDGSNHLLNTDWVEIRAPIGT